MTAAAFTEKVVKMEDPSTPATTLANGDHGSSKEVENGVNYGQNGESHHQILPPEHAASSRVPSMPPQQVYVSSSGLSADVNSLEHQFHAMGMGHPNQETEGPDEGLDGDVGDDADNDEETSDEDPLKLFVGQIPKSLSEEDIFPVFEPFGPLKDLAIIRDKHTGLHRGCAFVTYWSSADGERAQEALHDRFTFPGGRRAAQVKPAEPSGAKNKLFIGMLSRKAGEAEVRELFSPFGEIREIFMIRNTDGSSKCAAFLRFVERESAVSAIEKLNQSMMMEGATRPLIVKFADNKQQRQARQMRHTRRDHLLSMRLDPFGGYQMPLPGPMAVPPQYQIPGYPPPPQGTPYAAGTPPPPPHQGHHAPHLFMYPPHPYGAAFPSYPLPDPSQQEMRAPNPRPREGPAGANLFVYHLPHDLTDADLATAFNPFGNVISAKVYVDRNTGESKGFGFVSYDSVVSAEAAIDQMNGFQIGNKRLKVQHKRVTSSMPPSPSGPVSLPGPAQP